MSYIRSIQKCDDCGKMWNIAFGIVGKTMIGGGGPKECPYCDSPKISYHDHGWLEDKDRKKDDNNH